MEKRPPSTAPQLLAQALGELARTRAPAAWELLVTQIGSEVFDFSRRILRDENLAHDATQETLLLIRDCAGQFSPDEEMGADESARRWIMRIACTTALKIMRTRKRAQLRDEAYAKAWEAEGRSRSDEKEAQPDPDLAARVRDAVEALPDRERLPVLFHYYAGLDYAQIAVQLGCPVGTAKTNVHRGVEKLRERIAVLGVIAPLGALESSLRIPPAPTPASAIQIAKWKALLTAPKLAAATGVAATTAVSGGVSIMVKIGAGVAAAVLATAAVVAVPRAFSAGAVRTAPSTPVPAAQPATAGGMEPWEIALRQKLQKVISFEFSDQPLSDAVVFLKQVTRCEIKLSAEASDRKLDEKLVNLALTNVPAETALKLLGYVSGLEITYKEGAAVIGLPSAKVAALPAYVPTADDAAVRAKLQKHTTFKFEDTPFGDCVGFFRTVTHVNFVMHPTVQNNKKVFSIQWEKANIEDALYWIGMSAGVQGRIADGVYYLELRKPDARVGQLEPLLATQVDDHVVGLSVSGAVAKICEQAKIAYSFDPGVLAATKDKLVDAADMPTGSTAAFALLDSITAAHKLDVKLDGNALKLVPHQPTAYEKEKQTDLKTEIQIDYNEADLEFALESLRKLGDINTVVMTDVDLHGKIAFKGTLPLQSEFRQMLCPLNLVCQFRNGALAIGHPAEIWALEELPPPPGGIPEAPAAPKAAKPGALPGTNDF